MIIALTLPLISSVSLDAEQKQLSNIQGGSINEEADIYIRIYLFMLLSWLSQKESESIAEVCMIIINSFSVHVTPVNAKV